MVYLNVGQKEKRGEGFLEKFTQTMGRKKERKKERKKGITLNPQKE